MLRMAIYIAEEQFAGSARIYCPSPGRCSCQLPKWRGKAQDRLVYHGVGPY